MNNNMDNKQDKASTAAAKVFMRHPVVKAYIDRMGQTSDPQELMVLRQEFEKEVQTDPELQNLSYLIDALTLKGTNNPHASN